ncbi:hypothetical protein CPER28S_00197 [Cellulomonas persica]
MGDDDGVPLDVDPPTTRAPRELGVLTGRHVHVPRAVPLHELLEHHGPRGHVDAERQGLRGEHDLHQTAGEQVLDRLLEQREHAGVVRSDAAREGVGELPVAEHLEVLGWDRGAPLLDHLTDLGLLGGRRQTHPGGQALLDRGLAPGTREDEHDRGQEALTVEQVDDREPGCGADPRPAAAGPPTPGAVASAAPVAAVAGTASVVRRARGEQPAQVRVDRRVDARVRGVDVAGVQLEQLVTYQDVLTERHGPVLAHDDGRVTAHGGEPVAELLGVRDRRRQRDELHVVGQVDDDLFPHRTPEPVGEVVHLVHHDEAQPGQRARPRVEHVAQDLGRHDDDRGLGVHRRVAREQPHLVRAVAADQVGVLLVGQRLDRRRVERLAARDEREVHGELADDRLARPGRRRHEHPAAALERAARLDLEVVELEPDQLAERRELTALVGRTTARGRVPLGRRELDLVGRARLRSAGPRGARRCVERARGRRRRTLGRLAAMAGAGRHLPTLGTPGQARTDSAPGTTLSCRGSGPIRSPSANAGGGTAPRAGTASTSTSRARSTCTRGSPTCLPW